jgi:antitoxin (DNA-binding transcriptional repressor) of toxin-antitoxin stability system
MIGSMQEGNLEKICPLQHTTIGSPDWYNQVMSSVTIEQAASQLGALVDAALAGDEVVLAKNGQGVLLVPVKLTDPSLNENDSPIWSDVLKDFIGKAEGLPSDMARNHDHYLHGAAKK